MTLDSVARQTPRDDGIFIKTLPYRAMSRFSCPLLCAEDLQKTLRGRRVWVLGTDGHVKKTLARAFVVMKNVAESITFVSSSLKKQDLPLLNNFHSQLAGSDSRKDVVLLAEDDYTARPLTGCERQSHQRLLCPFAAVEKILKAFPNWFHIPLSPIQ